MVYSTNVLETVAQCDLVLTEVVSTINDLTYKKAMKEAQIVGSGNNVSIIPSQLASIETQIANKQVQLAAATTEMDQRSIEIELNSLDSQKLRLMNRLDSFEGLDLLDKQLEVSRIEKAIVAMDEYKTAIEARKTELQASAPAA